MRDYKNVKVPTRYRRKTSGYSVKRVDAGRSRPQKGGSVVRGLQNALLAAVLAGSCWLAWQAYEVLTHAEMFQIAGVDVQGVHQLSDGELKAIVGAFTGQNIFKADLDAAVRRARSNAWVREVRLNRSLPNRISMTVAERVPFAVLDTDTGKFLMDNEAVVIERVAGERASAPALPTIAIKEYRPHPGEPVTTESINEALTLLAEIEARGGWNLADVTVRAASPETLSLVYADHEFRIGSGRYDEKLRRLAEVMADVKQRNLTIAYVDLRPENQAAVMVREGANSKAANAKRQTAKKHPR